jgi:hypothetical protein
MIEPGLPSARGDRKVHPWVFEHPLCIVGLDDGRRRGKQRGIKMNRMRKVSYCDVDMQTLHGDLLQAGIFARLRAGLRDVRRANFGSSAAILREICDQAIHGLELRGVDHRTAVAPNCDEARFPQSIQMKCQCIGSKPSSAAISPAATPCGPACTSNRKASRRLSCERAASA